VYCLKEEGKMRKDKPVALAIMAVLAFSAFIVLVQAPGEDAGDPVQIPYTGRTYYGSLPNGTRYEDWYNFTVYYVGQPIEASLLTADNNWYMTLYGPSLRDPPGAVGNITAQMLWNDSSPIWWNNQADWIGNWSVRVVRNSTQAGNYTLIVQGSYPPRPCIFVEPASRYAAIGQVFTVNVEIDADSFWDVAGFDITFTYDPTLISLVSVANGTFLGSDVFGFQDTSVKGVVHAVSSKLSDPVPSGVVDTLITMQFNVTCRFSHQPVSCNLGLSYSDLAFWSHVYSGSPLWSSPGIPPWSWQDIDTELPYDPRPVPPAEPWTHYTINGTFSVNLGDVNNDGVINLQDLAAFAQAYGSHCANYHYQGEPASPNWNERATLAPRFGQIGLTDLVTFAVYYSHP
jgi:hypothetical protein